MKNTIENNLKTWDETYTWTADGDEWSGQARWCGQPYEVWKASLIETFIHPHVNKDTAVLEIAPGHGRWATSIVDRCKSLTLVDLSPNCIKHCQGLFADKDNVTYSVNDGQSLDVAGDGSIDFIWSFDSFVHIAPDVIRKYFREFHRVLVPGGRAIIHHAGRKDGMLWLGFLVDLGILPRNLYDTLSMGKLVDYEGWRSHISGERIRRVARESDLVVESQVRTWGPDDKFAVKRFGDLITTLRKP